LIYLCRCLVGLGIPTAAFVQLAVLTQMFVISLACYNLFHSTRMVRIGIGAFAAGASLVVLLQLIGASAKPLESASERLSAWGQDANLFACIVVLGLISLIGLLTAGQHRRIFTEFAVWAAVVAFGVVVVSTGSRGAFVALVPGLAVYAAAGWGTRQSPVLFAIRLGMVVLVIGIAFASGLFVERWQSAYEQGDMSSREVLFPLAWRMFLEKPWWGWGPVQCFAELGRRAHVAEGIEAHNLPLSLLVELGLPGAVTFLTGYGLCLLASWKARAGRFGFLPLALMVALTVSHLSLTWYYHRVGWLILALALACGEGAMVGSQSLWHRWLLWLSLRRYAK
jgi:O-antigen ligase